ncbi:HTH-type transcriptional activator IlvY [Lentisalinibacter sediminis]|uniref:HTH-type transcriptional activator IlvY n=1 Tax=Lentisalinibacter sediminis TaxID=2992237 RepID=UPI00386D768D
MDDRSLRACLSLADTLHYGRASAACHMSPSTLSRIISGLEEELGVRLFERDNRSVTLTPAGERFRTWARETLEQWEALRAGLAADSDELTGEISIYCSVTASYSFLYDPVAEFRRRHRRVRITVHTGDPEQAVARVRAGDEDLAIGARPERLPAGLAFEPMAVSPLVFIASREDPDMDRFLKPRMRPADWASVPMILPERGLARERVERWFRDKGIRPQVLAQAAGNEAIVSMVGLGGGVGVVPLIVLENSPLAGRVRQVAARPALAPFEVGLFARRKRLGDRLVRAFWSALTAGGPAPPANA